MWKRNIWIILFFIFLIFLIFYTYKNYGIGWDETYGISTGAYYLSIIYSFFHIPFILDKPSFIPGIFHIKSHGVFFDIINILIAKIFHNDSFELNHLIKALTSLLAYLFTVLTVNKIINKRAAFISAILLFLFPRFYGNIFFNPFDIPAAVLFSFTVFYFIYFIKSNQSIGKQIILGLSLALTINQRMIFWYIFVLIYLFLYILRKKSGWVLFFQLIFMHLTHPYLFNHPIIGIIQMAYSSLASPWSGEVLFSGTIYRSVTDLPWYYLPQSMLVTIPLITQFLFLIGNIYLIRQIRVLKNQENRLIYIFLLAIFYIPILFVIILRPIIYDSWRQFIFLSIPLVIIAAFGFDWLTKIKNRIFYYSIVLIILVNFVLIGRQMVLLHPYEYIYFNSLTGGLKGAFGRYETDYWGLSYRETVLWFNKNVNNPKNKYVIFVEGNPISSSYYFKSNMELTEDPKKADYLFLFTRENVHLKYKGKIIHVIEREGAPLNYIIRYN